MKKRITGLLLAVALVFSVVASIAPIQAQAATEFKTSDDCITVLKAEEGFSRKPYWDYAQYTVGYGTRCPDDKYNYYMEHGITEEEAEVLLRNHLTKIEHTITTKIIEKHGLTLNQNQFDALVMFSYNCGTGWTSESGGTFYNAIVSGATGNDLIRAFALWCSAGGEIKTFLLRRRLCEANMYLNGVYSQTPPDNYDYVLYDANGGSTSPRSQGYDSNLTAAPYPVPTYSGYTFAGWYTARDGGTKVTVLNASTAGKTLYAHWVDANGKAPEKEEIEPVTVKVTGSDVNIRSGPGTNYVTVGTAQKNDQLVITETMQATGYLWGKFDRGWIALQYTNYDQVKNQGTTPEQKPEETPEQKPETTPEQKPDPAPEKIMGTVNVQEWLRVRSGPGTNYAFVKYLYPKDRVEILEKKTVGATVWGKISDGWISLDYVILDKPSTGNNTGSNNNNNNGTTTTPATTWTGKIVNCTELRIRSGAGLSYSIVGYLAAGTSVTITERKTVSGMEWGKISKGWISLDYVKLDSTTSGNAGNTGNSGNTGNTNSTTVTGVVKVNDWLRVRSGPGTTYSVAGYLKPNEKVTITERKTVSGMEWGKISSGWISMDYVKLDSTSSNNNSGNTTTTPAPTPTAQTKTITADCLCVRSGAGTNYSVVAYVYYGAKVTVTETKTAGGRTWGKISKGWIAMDYTK